MRLRIFAVAVLAPAAVVAGSVPVASATPHHHHHHHRSYPASQGWTAVDVTHHLAAGQVCSMPTQVRVKGHERILDLKGHRWVPVTDPNWTPSYGDTTKYESPDESFWMSRDDNRRHHKVIHKKDSGTFIEHIDRHGNLRGIGLGKNFYVNSSVAGFLWTDGVQKYTEHHVVQDPANATVEFRMIKGPRQELCGKLGLKPVLSAQ